MTYCIMLQTFWHILTLGGGTEVLMQQTFYLFFSELGEEWAPVIMNTEAEYNFIRSADYYLTDVHGYYLGGTTNVEWTYENYNDYIPNNSGQ